ncbi:ABC transporter ATP-binding protein [Sorangium sp. So ce131]|uniref:ABC transporter ATP-binding protein n=1 Tax=Sorangium sp. So ce131 TaxID=3133282 RepID=UPI003F611BC5
MAGAPEEIVAVESLTKTFGGVAALSDVSFRVRGPGLVGILGPNGAGKTTLLDILEGLSEPTRGAVRVFGAPVPPYPRRRVGVVMQKEVQLERCTTREYAGLFAAIYGVRDGERRILERARLTARAAAPMSRLSGGEAARLFIATALVHEPELLLLDEPTAPLDPASKQEVGEMLRAVSRERTVLMTTHDLREADGLCDHLLFLVGGKLRASGPRDELVAAVPEGRRTGLGVEDAFFHFCAVRMRHGEAEEAR